MPRKPRFFLPGVPVHVVQRGRNREAVFFEETDYGAYLDWVAAGAQKYSCAVHAWCLMTNHIHLLVSSSRTDGVTRLMQFIGRHYVPFVNHKYGRSGSIWEGRFKSSLVDAEHYLLACMRYIELNPVAAGMVAHASQYLWSSYRANAEGHSARLITHHPVYQALGQGEERLHAYQALFRVHQDELDAAATEIRSTVQTGTPLASGRFREQVERQLGRKAGQARRGRPTGFKLFAKAEDGTQHELEGL